MNGVVCSFTHPKYRHEDRSSIESDSPDLDHSFVHASCRGRRPREEVMKRILPVVLVCLLFASCERGASTLQEGPVAGWSYVAAVDGVDDIIQTHITSLLDSH